MAAHEHGRLSPAIQELPVESHLQERTVESQDPVSRVSGQESGRTRQVTASSWASKLPRSRPGPKAKAYTCTHMVHCVTSQKLSTRNTKVTGQP